MNDPTDRKAVERLEAYTAERERLSVTSSELGDHIHGFGTRDGETALFLSDIRALLNAKEAAEAERDAARKLAEVTEACLRMMDHALSGTDKGDMAINPDGSLTVIDGWVRLAAYRRATLDQPKEGKDDE